MQQTGAIRSRIELPLLQVERYDDNLKEAISAGERRRFFQMLRRRRHRIGQLDREGLADLRRMLQETRRTIITAIAEAKDFRAVHVRELAQEFNLALESFRRRYTELALRGIDVSAQLGIEPIQFALASRFPLIAAPGLSPTMIEAAATMTGDLISGLTGELRDRIMRTVRLGTAGVHDQTKAIKLIGRNLTDPSIFRTYANRAETIWRTETGRIRSQAFLTGMDQVKDTELPKGVKIKKEWIWSGIGREEHQEIDGVQVDPDEDFTDGYGNSGPAPRMFGEEESDINCGCDVIVTIVEEGEE